MSQKIASLYAEIGSDTAAWESGAESVRTDISGLKDDMSGLGTSADDAHQHVNELAQGTKELGNANGATGISIEQLNQGLEIGRKAMEAMRVGYEQTIGKAMEYDDVIEQQARLGGTSAEEASKFVGVLKNWQVSADDVQTATKALTKQGLEPNIETLKSLSSQYIGITGQQERNAFVLKNLGKAGLEWEQVLEQGPAKLQAQTDALNQNIIVTDAALAQAEQLRLSQKELNDTWNGLTITVGNKAIPTMNNWVDTINKVLSGEVDWGKQLQDHMTVLGPLNPLLTLYGDTANENAAKMANMSDAQKDATATAQTLAEAEQAAADANKAMSDANTNYISGLTTVTSMEDNYTKTYTKNQNDIAGIMAHITQLRAQGYSDYGQTITGEMQKVRDIGQAERELAANRDRQGKEFILSQMLQILSVDGLTDKELAAYLKQGQAYGLFTQKYVDETTQMINKAHELASGIDVIPTQKQFVMNMVTHQQELVDVKSKIDAIPDQKTVEVDVHTNYTYSGTPGPNDPIPRASGGPASGRTLVGEHGPEMVNLPSGSYVNTNTDTQNMMRSGASGGSTTQTTDPMLLDTLAALQASLIALPAAISHSMAGLERMQR